MIGMIPRYINFYLHKITTKTALWQRYTSSRRFLGDFMVLADAIGV